MTIRVYTSKHCQPCQEVDRLIKEGRFNGEIELIDIETEEGFLKFKEEVLDHGDAAVPSAYQDGKKCTVKIDEENKLLLLECPTDALPSTDEG